MNARPFIVPSFGFLINWTPSCSKRSHAFSTFGTTIPMWPALFYITSEKILTVTARILVAVVITKVGIVLSSPVTKKVVWKEKHLSKLGEFDGCQCRESITGPLGLVCGNLGGILVSHEKKRKLGIREVQLLQKSRFYLSGMKIHNIPHPQDFCVEWKGLTGIFDTIHGLLKIEAISFRSWLTN